MKRIFTLITSLLVSQHIYSQNNNTITTAVPFLLINPNAQSMGLGDIGVVAAAGYYESGLTQNPALLSRTEKVIGLKFSYKPWIRHIAPDVTMMDAGFYYAFSEKMAIGYSYNLFSLGTVNYVDINGNYTATANPKEFSHNLKYAYSLTPDLSLGLGLKYVVSNITNDQLIHGAPTHAGRAIAGDLGMDYRKEIAKKETSFWRYDIGASIVNMGNKVSYTDTAHGDFLPMQLSLGTMWSYNKDINEHIRYCIDLAYQLEKLLVPTPPIYSSDTLNGNRRIIAGRDPNVSVFRGAFQSFYDAPDGVSEEFAEIVHKVGIENRFVFNKESSVALRLGVLNENKRKGNRNHFNIGLGGKYKFIYLDFGMILFYKSPTMIDESVYVSGIRNPHSWNVNIGFKYTFKDKEVSEPAE